MSYSVSQGSVSGRIGSAIGKGLAESIPKEVERGRLAAGLKELSGRTDLTPFQQFAELSSIPGITPQAIQSGTELLKTQGQRNNYRNSGGQGVTQGISANRNGQQNQLNKIDFANLGQRKNVNPQSNNQEEPSGESQILQNPLNDKFVPANPWNAQERDAEISKVWDQHPNLTFPEVSQIVSDNEQRYLKAPEVYREQQDYLEGVRQKVNSEIESQLKNKLQKTDLTGIWGDTTGESLNNIQRGALKDLAENPKANVADIANTWTNRALEWAKSKNELESEAARGILDKINPKKKEDLLNKLKTYSKHAKEFGASEEYYRKLKKDFDLSPQAAASIAWPLSKQAKEYTSKVKTYPALLSQFNPAASFENARKYGSQIGEYLTRNDSLLSIARAFQEKDPSFDQSAFFQTIRENQDQLGLTPLQKRELEKGERDIFPNWGDLFLFPAF